MAENQIERRFYTAGLRFEKRAGDDPPTLRGHAAVFNKVTELWPGVREIIAPGAFARALRERQDVKALVNHDAGKLLGRTKVGTLELNEDKIGLRSIIFPPNTTVAADTMELVQRGDLDQMSFGFRVPEDGDTITELQGGELLRTLVDVDLVDVSVVTFPQYPEASVSVRECDTNRGALEARIERWRSTGGGVFVPDAEWEKRRAVLDSLK